jgi:hypothetical protein
MKKLLAPIVVLLGLVVGSSPVAAAPTKDPNPNRPTEIIDGSGTLDAGVFCPFQVDFVVTGKAKVIEGPNGRTIFTSPNQKITLTNGTKSVSYVITGVRRETRVETATGPVLESVDTGRNIVLNGPDSARQGIFLLVGDFNFAVTATTPSTEVRVFSGKGQVIDICAALA